MRAAVATAVLAVAGSARAQEPPPPPAPAPAAGPVTAFALPNGLRVRLRPIAGAKTVAVVVCFSVGGDHDPAGQSGLAHLVEHCYVTCAAGDVPARTADALMAAYPNAWNAQTGARHTVIATEVAPDRLEAELREAAARMGDLRIGAADLAREVPRIRDELANMYERMPGLAAPNHARAALRPAPEGGRHGGRFPEIGALTPEQVAVWWHRVYKPANAICCCAGALDAEQARALVTTHFGPLAPGEPVPPPADPLPASIPAEPIRVAVDPYPGGPRAAVCLGFRVPSPADPAFAPFGLALARLWVRPATQKRAADRILVQAAPLDDPGLCFVLAALGADEAPEAGLARLRAFVSGALAAPLASHERMVARQTLAPLLGTRDLPDAVLRQGAYGVAFGLARREQLGCDGAALGAGIEACTAEAFAAAVAALDPAKAVAVIAAPK